MLLVSWCFFFSSRRRHTRSTRDWSSDVCSSDLNLLGIKEPAAVQIAAVWIELLILAALAAVGFWRWNPQNLTTGVPPGSLGGVIGGRSEERRVGKECRPRGAPSHRHKKKVTSRA